MLDIEPLFSRIIAMRKEIEKVGSIFVPETATSMRATEGRVVAIGNEVDFVKVGDKIYWGKYSGAEIERHGVKYIIMNCEDVLGIIKEGKP